MCQAAGEAYAKALWQEEVSGTKGPNEEHLQLEPRAKRIEVQGEVREAPSSSCTLKSDPRYNSGDMMSPSTLTHTAPDFSLAFRKLNPQPSFLE